MAVYIHSDNQKVLWNTISNTPLYIGVYGSNNNNINIDFTLRRELTARNNSDPREGEKWFRNIIQCFYENNRNILSTQLQEINKCTIMFMINELKQKNKLREPVQYETHGSSTIINEKKMNSNNIGNRQYEYENMFKHTVPAEIDFRENDEQENGNIDELLKNHIQKREEELSRYAPPLHPENTKAPLVAKEELFTKSVVPFSVTTTTTPNDSDASCFLPNNKTILNSFMQNIKSIKHEEEDFKSIKYEEEDVVSFKKTINELNHIIQCLREEITDLKSGLIATKD